MKRQVFSLLVENTSGVLSRIAGLFTRRGYNIDSITAGVTADERYSRITVVVVEDEVVLEQIEKQLAKLEEVIDIKELKSGASVCRELVMIKVSVTPGTRQEIISIADIFKAKIMDVCSEALVIELTGNLDKVDALIKLLEPYGILELARTGATGLSRGTADVKML
ncbi:MAG: acetolactate synthase small subunit [Lachnospiraceae bacterium]|nr:acetolactate synthase small subunit [Lachnospiraceae bacterium]